MATLFILFGYRFFFWSNEHEPVHVHVSKGDNEAKYEISPLRMIENNGFKKNEISMIDSILEENKEIVISRWHEYFKKGGQK